MEVRRDEREEGGEEGEYEDRRSRSWTRREKPLKEGESGNLDKEKIQEETKAEGPGRTGGENEEKEEHQWQDKEWKTEAEMRLSKRPDPATRCCSAVHS